MLKYCSILFMVSFSAPVVEQHTDYRSLHVSYGEKASLVCDFKNITNVGIIWWEERFKNKTFWNTLYDNDQINPLFNSSVSVKNNNISSIMTVNVPSDSKEYRCIVNHGKENTKIFIFSFNLTFIEPNISIKISNFTSGSQITVTEITEIGSTSGQTPMTTIRSSNDDTKGILNFILCIGICLIVVTLIAICTVIYIRRNLGNRTEQNTATIHEGAASFRMIPHTQRGDNPATNLETSNYTDAWA